MDVTVRRWLPDQMRTLDVDYLVVGAGAMGMAFTDALIDHSDARVAVVDRREAAGGHWINAYPFVRLHQASALYGVASTLLGGGQVQTDGPEAGLGERADKATICAYYEQVLARMLATGRVEFLPHTDYTGERTAKRLDSGGTGGARHLPCRRQPLPVTRHPCGDSPFLRRRATRGSCRSTTCPGSSGRPASTSSWARARPRPTPSCGCSGSGPTRTRSARCDRGAVDAQPGAGAA